MNSFPFAHLQAYPRSPTLIQEFALKIKLSTLRINLQLTKSDLADLNLFFSFDSSALRFSTAFLSDFKSSFVSAWTALRST